MTVRCPAGHELTSHGLRRPCARCRRDALIRHVIAAEGSLPAGAAAAAVDAVATSPAVLRELAAALAADPDMLAHGAPPVAGRLAAELIARGSVTVTLPRCARCGRAGMPLYRSACGGVCQRCRNWQLAVSCSVCGKVKPVAGRDDAGRAVCEVCRRRGPGRHRPCGRCGKTAPVAVRGRDGAPDICVNCYRMPSAVCTVCGKYRECNFAGSGHPVCPSCSPRAAARCARCGQDRPPAARWPEGPVCDSCYTAALRRRVRCASCGQLRRPVAPPGPAADTCANCAGQPVTCACADCGVEDKLYERGRCERCSLRRRAKVLLAGPGGDVPAALMPVFEAICAARAPKSALNWLRRSGGAAILAEVASGTLPATHQALDAHPCRRAADHLRQALVAGGVLLPRDEELARTEQWLTALLASIDVPEHRRLVHAYATWQVMRRLRASAGKARPRTYTAHARNNIRAAADFTAWLSRRGRPLRHCRQADVDDWLATGAGAAQVRDFLTWAAARRHCPVLHMPGPARHDGAAASQDQRWALAARLLHDDTLDLTDRAAGCLVLLYGQQLSRIAAMTTSQVTSRDDTVIVRFGHHDAPVPAPLGAILTQLIRTGRSHTGTGSPASTPWLFPGGLPGRPITPARLGERLRALGVYAMAGRRAALTDLAAQLPAAVLADLLGLAPGTAVHWMRQAGADWNRYAAELSRTRVHQHGE